MTMMLSRFANNIPFSRLASNITLGNVSSTLSSAAQVGCSALRYGAIVFYVIIKLFVFETHILDTFAVMSFSFV